MCSLGHREIGFEGSLVSNEMIVFSSPCPRAVPGCRQQQFHCSCLGSCEAFHAMCPSFGKQRELGSSFDSPAAGPAVSVLNCVIFLILDFWFFLMSFFHPCRVSV